MKIAFIGIRGIPVIYSGFETFVEQLAEGLTSKNNQAFVYCRSPYVNQKIRHYKKISLITIKTIRINCLETFVHSFFATIHACLFLKPQIIFYLGVGNSPFLLFARLFNIKTVINVDGNDWKRKKWNLIGKTYLLFCELLTTILADRIITDSIYMQNYYKKVFNKKTTWLSYPYFKNLKGNKKLLNKYGVMLNNYFIWVGRLVPDNNLEELFLAYQQLKTDVKCLIVGDDLYKTKYRNEIINLGRKDKRIIFTGFVPHSFCAYLIKNALCYVETKRSGGSHPSLIEAAGLNKIIISNNFAANKEVLNNEALFYQKNKGSSDLIKKLRLVLFNKTIYKKNKIKLKKAYQFNYIFNQYIVLFNSLIK